MSSCPLASPWMRFVAALANATQRPSAEIEASRLFPSPNVPRLLTLAHWIVEETASNTKTSTDSLVSPGTRLVTRLSNAM